GYVVRRLNPVRVGGTFVVGFLVFPILASGLRTGDAAVTTFWAVLAAFTGSLTVLAWYERSGESVLTRAEQWLLAASSRFVAGAFRLGAATIAALGRWLGGLGSSNMLEPLKILGRLLRALGVTRDDVIGGAAELGDAVWRRSDPLWRVLQAIQDT